MEVSHRLLLQLQLLEHNGHCKEYLVALRVDHVHLGCEPFHGLFDCPHLFSLRLHHIY